MILSMTGLVFSAVLIQTFSFETKAARIPIVLQQLQGVLDQELKSHSEFTNEVLVISAKNFSSKELLDRIASATSGKWIQDGKVLILKPDPELRKRQEAERLAVRQEAIQARLDLLSKELDASYGKGALEEAFRHAAERPLANAE